MRGAPLVLPFTGPLLAAALLAAGCGGERSQQDCRMDQEVVIGLTGRAPSAVGLARTGPERYLAAWSADGEVKVAVLEGAGLAARRVRRVEREPFLTTPEGEDAGPKTFWRAERGTSLDAEDLSLIGLADGGAALALLELPRHGRPGGAFVALIPGEEQRPIELVRVGVAGEFATRIAATARGGQVLVAWHEGLPGRSHVRYAAVDRATRRVLGGGRVPGTNTIAGPTIAAAGDHVLLGWSATRNQAGAPVTRVKVAAIDPRLELGPESVVATCRYLDPAPRLTRVGERFGIAFRDDADEDEKPEFYFGLLGPAGEPSGAPARISRADGFEGPRIDSGDPLVFSATIRSFQRSFLVGVNRFDRAGTKQGGEYQIYADKSDFIRVDLVAEGAEVALVYGEDRRGSGRVMASRVRCREGNGER